MSPFSCAREREVKAMLDRGHWPEACSEELGGHVASCPMCSDLVLVSQAFQRARKLDMALPRLDPAGALWWRAQLRRRNAAIEKVGRPILGAQIFALLTAVLVAAVAFAWCGDTLKAWFSALPRALHLGALMPTGLSSGAGLAQVLLPVLATIALLSGVVVYLSTEKQ